MTDCGCEYAKDKATVYHRGTPIIGSDPSSFTILDNNYAIDSHAVYYLDTIVTGADASTFVSNRLYGTTDNDRYDAKDKNHEYLAGRRVQ